MLGQSVGGILLARLASIHITMCTTATDNDLLDRLLTQ